MTFIAEASFDAECFSQKTAAISNPGALHLFIAGLARSGTTILMRSIYNSGQFCSLTYRDMPFVLAPNLWRKISGSFIKNIVEEERPHGDGIMVDFDSPEALEEVFWRVFVGEQYIRKDFLAEVEIDTETVQKFRSYIALILKKYGCSHYLSKNNNNILRVNAIREAFPKAKILIPYRNPLQQAVSLLRQHKLFSKMHANHSFSKQYMKWLVHHEFGAEHRPFEWGLDLARSYSPYEVEYWLAQWAGVYSHLLKKYQRTENVLFVGYEIFCERTDAFWNFVEREMSIHIGDIPSQSKREADLPSTSDVELMILSNNIYNSMNEICLDKITGN